MCRNEEPDDSDVVFVQYGLFWTAEVIRYVQWIERNEGWRRPDFGLWDWILGRIEIIVWHKQIAKLNQIKNPEKKLKKRLRSKSRFEFR
ncbi:hypothetical protein HK098_000539 [Nowakowskiella sp. JEL0407]|nr:hypothetical protein HK098_000539 [Nowakowskiella sp. JEL0407]